MRGWLSIAFVLIDLQGLDWRYLIGQTQLLSLATYGRIIIVISCASTLWRLKRGILNSTPLPTNDSP